MKHFTTKGDGLSFNVIVAAVIAVLILVVLVFMFLNGVNPVTPAVNSCNGKCVIDKSYCSGNGPVISQKCTTDSGSQGAYCCLAIGG